MKNGTHSFCFSCWDSSVKVSTLDSTLRSVCMAIASRMFSEINKSFALMPFVYLVYSLCGADNFRFPICDC